MNRTTALVTVALIGLAGPAMAADIDDIVPASLAAAQADADARGPEDKAQNRSPRASRPSSSNGKARPQAGSTSRTSRSAPPARSSSPPRPSAAPPARPSSSRPSATVRPAAPARPTASVRPSAPVRPLAARPVHSRPAVVHTRPVHQARPVVVHRRPVVHTRTVVYRHVHPYHGVFVYGPRPATHVHYHTDAGPQQVRRVDLPERAVDRNDSLAIGFKGGSMVSSTPDAQVYGDAGLGLVGRYRPAETVALELGVQRHVGALGSDLARSNTQASGSVALFAFPWTRVSPYAIGGVTYNAANVGFGGDTLASGGTVGAMRALDAQWGLHGGLGVEFALGDNFALDLEGRYIGWIDERLAGEAPGALQATAGVLLHFK